MFAVRAGVAIVRRPERFVGGAMPSPSLFPAFASAQERGSF